MTRRLPLSFGGCKSPYLHGLELNSGLLGFSDSGFWDSGILGFGDLGSLGFGDLGILGVWDFGTLVSNWKSMKTNENQ